MDPTGLQVLVFESYSSALVRCSACEAWPPVTSTLPENNSVAVWLERPVARAPAELHVLVTGSYTSVLARQRGALKPPVTSTWPEGNGVAVCAVRPIARFAVEVHLPLDKKFRAFGADRSWSSVSSLLGVASPHARHASTKAMTIFTIILNATFDADDMNISFQLLFLPPMWLRAWEQAPAERSTDCDL
jgi:hypothetical protein